MTTRLFYLPAVAHFNEFKLNLLYKAGEVQGVLFF